MTVVLVGESNPYSADPRHALYPLPPNAAGGRLARALELSAREYIAAFPDRRNLLARTAKWSAPLARCAADDVLRAAPLGAVLVLLGAKVSAAFGVDYRPALFLPRMAHVGTNVPRRRVVLVLPHPSGLCREWNDPQTALRVQEALREVGALPAQAPAA